MSTISIPMIFYMPIVLWRPRTAVFRSFWGASAGRCCSRVKTGLVLSAAAKADDENGEPTKIYSWDYQRPFDGSWFRVFSAAFRWGGRQTAHVVSSADITDNKRNEALVEYLANYDSLTNLPNRRMLVKECERRIDKTQGGRRRLSAVF